VNNLKETVSIKLSTFCSWLTVVNFWPFHWMLCVFCRRLWVEV